ncbi:hypothetical protein OAU50_08220 [Planctomycetota bacterium]|nr:hypothetical protein [Planctomycetota bacterium]
MSVISCQSCGMQYNGEGMQAGVQFKCTGCGAMVQVGGGAAAAPRSRVPGGKRPTGRAPAGGRGQRAGGPRPAGGGRQGGGGQSDGPRFGPPAKKGNSGAIVGIIIGVIAVGIIIAAVVGASGPSPQEAVKDARKAKIDEQNKATEAKNAQIAKENADIQKAFDASLALAKKIKSAFENENSADLAALFDWDRFAEENRANAEKDKRFLNSPMFYVGEWTKNERGENVTPYIGKSARGGSDLKDRVIAYLDHQFYGGEVEYDTAKSEHEEAKISKEISGKKALGYKLSFKFGGGKAKIFHVVTPIGSDQAKIVFYEDKGHAKTIADIEAKPKHNAGGQDLGNVRDPRNPVDPTDPDAGEDPVPTDPDASLPEAKATGAYPEHPDLVNLVKEICERGKPLRVQNRKKISGKAKAEKKATMGAFIDALLKAVNDDDRHSKQNISSAMYDIWGDFIPGDWSKSDMTYDINFSGDQDSTMLRIRRWLSVYNGYSTE